ncbi:helix-turn-helix transcriptional regulator [Humibacillus xanthopallidus]|uniref:DNA-binding CsgD family transcriptional regulator n=1 Tax=Humibacillus xanthopallidus TaxID=412689 RepID=A0A543I2P9_9MICO|nr:helix-turn-helix transcriptional regulator [Humibacillus xanthopallidus]TQM64874.1 DNA-binding CsgD family transcriptional regulator [Humibacillus xanthopallidus]
MRRSHAHARDAIERICRRGGESRALRQDVLEQLRHSVGFDWYVWMLTDPATSVGVDPVAHVPDLLSLPTTIRLKYLTTLNRWTSLTVAANLAERAAESDLWSEVQRPLGVIDVASVALRDPWGCWGFLDLWSTTRYAADDLALLRVVAPVLTTALRDARAAQFRTVAVPLDQVGSGSGRSSGSPRIDQGPAVVLLDDGLSIVGQTTASDELLAMLLPGAPGVPPVPAAVYNVAAALVASEAGVDQSPPMARVPVADGVWLTLRASRITPGAVIAVTIEPSSPADRLDVFARAHGLSERERELLTLLAGGADTRQIAASMLVSRHTVQDHLKSIFAKTGTHTRRVLLSHVLGVAGASSGL